MESPKQIFPDTLSRSSNQYKWLKVINSPSSVILMNHVSMALLCILEISLEK